MKFFLVAFLLAGALTGPTHRPVQDGGSKEIRLTQTLHPVQDGGTKQIRSQLWFISGDPGDENRLVLKNVTPQSDGSCSIYKTDLSALGSWIAISTVPSSSNLSLRLDSVLWEEEGKGGRERLTLLICGKISQGEPRFYDVELFGSAATTPTGADALIKQGGKSRVYMGWRKQQ
jgi:hypothetical protein